MENTVTGTIWAELDEPGLVTLHFDDDKAGSSIKLTPDQAREVVADLAAMISCFDAFDSQVED